MADVSELFDPDLWRAVDGFDELTDITYHHDGPGRVAASPSTGPRCATPSVRTQSTSCTGHWMTRARTLASVSCC